MGRPRGGGICRAEPWTRPTSDEIQPLLQTGYPWHTPEIPHPELDSPAKWWERVEQVISRAYVAFGLPQSLADEMAAEVHARYIDPAGYVVYDDSFPTLRELGRRGWRHLILSNHVPELPDIVAALGLRPFVEEVITSARVDYEKPNPAIFPACARYGRRPGRSLDGRRQRDRRRLGRGDRRHRGHPGKGQGR